MGLSPTAKIHTDRRLRRLHKLWLNARLASRRRALRELLPLLPPARDPWRLDRDLGLRVIPADHGFGPVHDLVRMGRGLVERGRFHAYALSGSKPHFDDVLDRDELCAHPEIKDFALHPRILALAADYLGDFPIFTQVWFWRSKRIEGAFGSSQLYHCDAEDLRQLKVFVFVSDVGEENGPLTAVDAATSRAIKQALGYDCASRLSDEAVRSRLPSPDSERVCTGPAGTVALVDTSRVLHFGSRVTGADRYVLAFQYLPLANFARRPELGNLVMTHLVDDESPRLEAAALTGVVDPRRPLPAESDVRGRASG